MDSPGLKTLAALQIGVARSLALLTPITGLAGMSSCNLVARFQYGSGGATFSAIVATSFDDGATWLHIARFDFTTSAVVDYASLSSVPKAITAYVDLAAAGVNDGLLGDQLAVYIVSTGTYVNTTFDLRAHCR
jgi:hypothetical protein